MLTLVHGSDLHFGKPHDPEAAEAFAQSARDLEPDVIVISGDFTQRAKVHEYRAARAYLDRLPDVPLVVTPGNHDVPLYRVFERLFAPFRNYRAFIREQLDTITRIPGLTIVSLNSASPYTGTVNGRIRPAQLAFAREAFGTAPPGDLRAVVTHHHLAPAPDYERDRPLPGARRILDAFTEMGVDLMMGGHLHRAYIGDSLDVHAGKQRDRGIVIVQCGTTTSRRGRAREQTKHSFNRIRVGRKSLEVTHFMYFRDAGGFAPFSVHAFPRYPALWFDSSALDARASDIAAGAPVGSDRPEGRDEG